MPVSEKGFTLFEVMVSMAIVMTMATISTPFIKRYQPNLKLDGTSRDLTSDLRLAQQYSIAEQVVHYVEIATSTRQYALYKTGSSTPIKTYSLPNEINFQSVDGFTNNRISFNAYGAVSESGSIVLSNDQKNKTINIKPSGYVEFVQ